MGFDWIWHYKYNRKWGFGIIGSIKMTLNWYRYHLSIGRREKQLKEGEDGN